MAFDKKPSKYSDRGAVGSPEELEAYGVWVKSEPQDLTASLAETVNFDADAVPYEADFDTGFGADFDNLGTSDFGFADFEPEINDEYNEAGGFQAGGFDDDLAASIERGTEEASTELLMKIAGELSSIKSELSTLKREFADIRAESGMKTGASSGDFYAGEEDEKIALTGDEMEDFFASTGLSDDEGQWPPAEDSEPLGFDALREADEAALKELSEYNETPVSDEEIEIDFDNLGIDLNNEAEEETAEEAQDDFPPLEDTSFDDDLSALSFDETSSMETTEFAGEEEAQDFTEELMPLESSEEDDELKELRIKGAAPHTPAPDNTDYLEGDPFALDDTGVEDTFLEETSLEETALEETALEETSLEETALVEDTVSEETSLDENAADLSFDDVSFDLNLDDVPSEDMVALEEETAEEQTTETLALTEEETEETSEETAEIAESGLDAGSLDLSEAVIDEPDLSSEIVEAPLEEPVLGDISFDDDISLDMDDFGTSVDLDAEDEGIAKDEALTDDVSVSEDLAIDDFEPSIDLDEEDSGFKIEKDEALVKEEDSDDSLAQVIPEGFEVNAQEAAVSLDDDLEAFGDELSIDEGEITLSEASVAGAPEAAGADINIPAGLKKDLKNVLSYMDHLLESLPEDKIEEFAQSEYFNTYKKIFKELGLV